MSRGFWIPAAVVLLGGASLTIGCGSGGGGSPTSPGSPTVRASPTANPNAPVLAPGDIPGAVTPNHPAPHFVLITAAQLAAGEAVVLDLVGGVHFHTLSLTAADVAQIARRDRLQRTTSVNTHSDGSDPHSHTVTFN
jgi:hypothetical protein